MNWKDHYLLTFESKNHTLLFFSVLEKGGHEVFQLVSAPCALKTGCSYAIKIPHKNYLYIIKREIGKIDLSTAKLFFLTKENGKTKYKEIPF